MMYIFIEDFVGLEILITPIFTPFEKRTRFITSIEEKRMVNVLECLLSLGSFTLRRKKPMREKTKRNESLFDLDVGFIWFLPHVKL